MSDIATLEVTIDNAKQMVSRKNMALKLASNREFKALVLEGYFNEEAARLASISADPLMAKDRGEIMLAIQGISLFRQYMQNIVRMGEVAERELLDSQEALQEALAEEGIQA